MKVKRKMLGLLVLLVFLVSTNHILANDQGSILADYGGDSDLDMFTPYIEDSEETDPASDALSTGFSEDDPIIDEETLSSDDKLQTAMENFKYPAETSIEKQCLREVTNKLLHVGYEKRIFCVDTYLANIDTPSNIYLIETTGINGQPKILIIDAGYSGRRNWEALKQGITTVCNQLNIPEKDCLAGVFLSHWHVDHIGLAYKLAETFGAKIYIHKRDWAIVTGELNPFDGWNPPFHMKWADRLYSRFMERLMMKFTPIKAIPFGDEYDYVPGQLIDIYNQLGISEKWMAIHFPGHSEGCSNLLLQTQLGTIVIGGDWAKSNNVDYSEDQLDFGFNFLPGTNRDNWEDSIVFFRENYMQNNPDGEPIINLFSHQKNEDDMPTDCLLSTGMKILHGYKRDSFKLDK